LLTKKGNRELVHRAMDTVNENHDLTYTFVCMPNLDYSWSEVSSMTFAPVNCVCCLASPAYKVSS
jgi:hypothetical protein